MGLSPRVRGSHIPDNSIAVSKRSIPASAGKPRSTPEVSSHPPVYPRECGEAAAGLGSPLSGLGLSPRVRGSQEARLPAKCGVGSIPASAGKPFDGGEPYAVRGVYPRECGEAPKRLEAFKISPGLSPRVRGSHLLPEVRMFAYRSIPASAGKPCLLQSQREWWRVYPRECGEALAG